MAVTKQTDQGIYEFEQDIMGYMCPDCYEFAIAKMPKIKLSDIEIIKNNDNIVNDNIRRRNIVYGPLVSFNMKCKNCNGAMVEIDADWVELISRLNKLGYKTRFCCSGHEYENNIVPYIGFEYTEEFANKIIKVLEESTKKPMIGQIYIDLFIKNNKYISVYFRGFKKSQVYYQIKNQGPKKGFLKETKEMLVDIIKLLEGER